MWFRKGFDFVRKLEVLKATKIKEAKSEGDLHCGDWCENGLTKYGYVDVCLCTFQAASTSNIRKQRDGLLFLVSVPGFFEWMSGCDSLIH